MFITGLFIIVKRCKKKKNPPTKDQLISAQTKYNTYILLGNKKEWSTNTYYNKDEPWKYIECENYLHKVPQVYMKCPE